MNEDRGSEYCVVFGHVYVPGDDECVHCGEQWTPDEPGQS